MTSERAKGVGARQAVASFEAPNHSEEKQQVLEAIKTLGLKVTPGSVAEKTGLPVLRVTQMLNRVAFETQGNLIVDSAGAVTYKFAPNFESSYLLNSSRDFFRWAFRVVFNATTFAIKMLSLALFFLVRISFGVLLILSVVLVVVLVIAAIVNMLLKLFHAGDADSVGGDLLDGEIVGDLGSEMSFDWLGGLRYWVFDWVWDWWFWPRRYFWWSPWDPWYDSRYDYTLYRADDYEIPSRRYEDQSSSSDAVESGVETKRDTSSGRDFLDNCFAVLFGCGDPNAQFQAERWRVVAQAIKAKSGVVIAEDLAPYVETDGKNEDWMLPILIRFNGAPDVTESGKLVYTFPAFTPASTIAPSKQGAPAGTKTGGATVNELSNLYSNFLNRQHAHKVANANAHALPPFIQEKTWSMTGLSAGEVVAVLGFACVASGGSLWLLTTAPSLPYIVMLRPILLGIAAYGALFFLCPLLRLPWLLNANARIEGRNEAHAAAAQLLAHPTEELSRYQRESAAFRSAAISGETSVSYSTERDSLEQEFGE